MSRNRNNRKNQNNYRNHNSVDTFQNQIRRIMGACKIVSLPFNLSCLKGIGDDCTKIQKEFFINTLLHMVACRRGMNGGPGEYLNEFNGNIEEATTVAINFITIDEMICLMHLTFGDLGYENHEMMITATEAEQLLKEHKNDE